MLKVSITEIKVGYRARFDIGNISELAEDINQHGMLHPLVVTPEYELIAGYRRLKAVELLGWQEIPVTIQVPSTENNSKFQIPKSKTDLHSAFRIPRSAIRNYFVGSVRYAVIRKYESERLEPFGT
jgi:hypothetical protein